MEDDTEVVEHKCRCGRPFFNVCIPCLYHGGFEPQFDTVFDEERPEPELCEEISDKNFDVRLLDGFRLRLHD
jgi:hypothetical protein